MERPTKTRTKKQNDEGCYARAQRKLIFISPVPGNVDNENREYFLNDKAQQKKERSWPPLQKKIN